jgi:Protein of unknown function (DUF5661)
MRQPNPTDGEERAMKARTSFTTEESKMVGWLLGVDWDSSPFDVEQFRMGLDVELEHGRRNRATDVTHDDPVVTAKIALAHLDEMPDYYSRLRRMEEAGQAEALSA